MTETETEETTSDLDQREPARETIEVRVGDRNVTIGRFRGYKATKLMQEAAAIGKRYPRIGKDLAAFKREYAEENAITLSRTEAEYQLGERAKAITDKAWDQVGGELRLRRTPSAEEQVIRVFPDLLEHAQTGVVRILALLAASNDELRAAWDEGDDKAVDEMLDAKGADLLFDADAEELLNLALAGAEVGRAQFAPLRERLGKLTAQLGLTQTPSESTSEPTTMEKDEPSPTTPPSSETRQPSSTDSPRPTDGLPERHSSESPGSRSEPSPVG